MRFAGYNPRLAAQRIFDDFAAWGRPLEMGGLFRPFFFAEPLSTVRFSHPVASSRFRPVQRTPTPGSKARQAPRGAVPAHEHRRQNIGPNIGESIGWQDAVTRTVQGLHYELVDVERGASGLLRITIDRLPAHAYAQPGGFVTVDDCEQVTRQLQYVLEVQGVNYARLEVSSPGLDRPLRTAGHYERFAGEQVSLNLKEPFQGRRHYQGRLEAAADGAWRLGFTEGGQEQALEFGLDEVREARLVPVVNFKGRQAAEKRVQPLQLAEGDRKE
jgi:ribosome maturation factor RimP